MKVIYIAGPYRSPHGEWGVVENIRKAEAAALFVWQYGGAALCPHKNTALFGGAPGCSDDVWLAGDIEMLLRCDAVWMIDGWRDSIGARRERDVARENGIPALFEHNDVIAFLNEEQE